MAKPRTKVQCLNFFFCKLASKDIFTPANSLKHMMSSFGHSQKCLLKKNNVRLGMLKKLASKNDVPSQKRMEKDVFTPNQLNFR